MGKIIGSDWQHARQVVRSVLAADCAFPEQAFLGEGTVIVPREEREGRRRLPMRPDRLATMTMGAGVVVSCDAMRVPELRARLGRLGRDDVFSVATIALLAQVVSPGGQVGGRLDLKHVCVGVGLRREDSPDDVEIAVVGEAGIPDLYRLDGFRNALAYRTDTPRPDVVATLASRDGEILGIATASADCDRLWQIDVVGAAHGQGIGRTLVSRLTREVLRRGRIPYYSTTVSNLRSRGLARSVGYRPCWTELSIQSVVSGREPLLSGSP